MKTFITSSVIALAGLASARHCQNITVPVTLTSTNNVYKLQTPVTNIDVTNFILNLTQNGVNFPQNIQAGTNTFTRSYKLATTLCNPDKGQADVVQILTHGIGFDRFYWDSAYHNYNNSYVAVAVDKYGYSTLSHDRLGIGQSSHGEPTNEIQAMLEVEALHALTQMLRKGTISGCEKPFKKVIAIGHSFGSVQSYALAVKYPTDVDALGLTGFSQNGTYIPYFALGGNFVQANKNPALTSYANGYFAAGDASAVQTNFLAPGQFSPELLDYAVKTGQPVTTGELLTIGSATKPVNPFKGPVLVITGERDVPFCGGNCLAAAGTGFDSIPAAAIKSFPNAKGFKAIIVPKAGHGLNYEYSHPFTYKSINDYFVSSGVPA